jgi:hypothetical protein
MRTHLEPNVECFGCTRMFREHSAIMIHLESGACPSRLNMSILDSWMRNERGFGQYMSGPITYYCPNCSPNFTHLSGLVQHIESHACNENVRNVMVEVREAITWRI